MQQYACPNCGAPLIFRSSVSVYSTCNFCQSMVLRHDMNLETLGKVAELLDDMSPFQVGTTGRYKNDAFTLVGRVKVIYDAGTWSEWYALFDDGREAWLAEAQGVYMLTALIDDPDLDWPDMLAPMEQATIQGQLFYIEDVKRVCYAASEGELPYKFTPHTWASSIDLRSDKGAFASVTIEGFDKRIYLGEYVPFDEFKFQNLRTIDGW
jgi:Domain of unknown function (DUF4178)